MDDPENNTTSLSENADMVQQKEEIEHISKKSKLNIEKDQENTEPALKSITEVEQFTSIEQFGYHFNEKGKLRHIKNDTPYEFNVNPNDKVYNQKTYELLGETITEHVYKLLEDEVNLKRIFFPIDRVDNEASGFLFMSQNALTTTSKMMILIHGNGVVRAGQWARKLIINESLESGTMLPYIKKAQKLNYEIVVLNGNQNFDSISKSKIRGNSNPVNHGLYVWEHYIKNSKASEIVIVAHSFGGVVTKALVSEIGEEQKKRIKAIAFTDSVHNGRHDSWMKNLCVNWKTSQKKVNTILGDDGDCENRSAGTTQHIETSWKSFDSVFDFIAEKCP